MGSPMLEAQDVAFSWGDRRVLDGFSLTLEEGSVGCLMGVNGCGKTTFLDCLLAEHAPEHGVIRVAGQEVARLRAVERARLMSYVPQVHERTFPFDVLHLVAMGRLAYQPGLGAVGAEDRALALRALEDCGVARLAGRPCTELSGGEMQMVLLARALAQDASLVVLDEPTAHLDFRNELVFLETVARLVRERGVTAFMATHAPSQAFHLADAGLPVQVALMVDGRVARAGSPGEVLTPDALRECFGVRACIARGEADGRPVRQIVPVGTVSLSDKEDVPW